MTLRLVVAVAAMALMSASGVATASAAPSPVAAYSFDESTGAVAEDSIGPNDGTISGATWEPNGKYGSALNFDGVNDLVTIADANDLDLTSQFTLEAWVRPDTLSAVSPVITKAANPGTGQAGYLLAAQAFGKPGGFVAHTGNTVGASGTTALPIATWTHIAFTSDGTNLRFYVNATLTATVPAITAQANTAPLEIGHHPLYNTYFDGTIDEVRLYGQALNQTEIQADRDARVAPPSPWDVTTNTLDTGSHSELASSIPITDLSTPDPGTVIYSQAISSIAQDELLEFTATLELTNDRAYPVSDSVQVVLGADPDDPDGTVVTPWSSVTHSPSMRHWTFPIVGSYHATSDLGTRYLKVVARAQSASPGPSDTLTVQQNFGHLAVVRSTPAVAPMSQPTHRVQPHLGQLSQVTSSVPVDSAWRRVMTRKVTPLAYDDILRIASQLEVHNASNATVRVESKITRTTTPTYTGSHAGTPVAEQVGPDKRTARLVHSNHLNIVEPEKGYLNLSVRAIPVSGTPAPLTIAAGTTLDVLRHAAHPGDPAASRREGTRVDDSIDFNKNVDSIPYASGGAQKRVVASAPLYGGIWKDEILRARGLITSDLAGTTEATQILTRLIVADSPTDTTGETFGAFSGDKVPPSAQTHTSVKEGVYVAPVAEPVIKYVNFVVYASQLNPTGSMSVDAASMYVTRTKRIARIDDGFEGTDTSRLGSVFEYEINGPLSASTEIAREGNRSLQADVNQLESHDIRRVEVRPPDLRSAGGYHGEESWHGFSAYFPDEFQVPGPDPVVYFDGLIDEVRVYNQALSAGEISADRDGSYSQTPAPAAAYGFDEGTGGTAIDSAGSNDGQIDGAQWVSGKYGSALEFDGGDDSVSIPDAPSLDLTGPFTIEAWVRPDLVSSWTGTPVISKLVDPGSNPSGYLLRAAASGARPAGSVADSGMQGTALGGSPLPLGQWSHLALTSDGTTLRLYVNGSLVGSAQAGTGAAANQTALTIGASNFTTATAGTWNIFAQWHHLKDENPLIGCPDTQGGGVPISFNVRHYRAGAVTNPGETQTATPIEGPYIEVMFNGGEMDVNCDQVNGTQRFVLAPLERNRWYDFVLHTRWTQLAGTPGDSVSEVWMDGVQVLGDQSVPVFRPTLSWRGTPSTHNFGAYWQFGLYRGPSRDDPASRLHIDAVRSGNSYSEVAPGQ